MMPATVVPWLFSGCTIWLAPLQSWFFSAATFSNGAAWRCLVPLSTTPTLMSLTRVAAGPDGFHVYVPVGSVGELVLFFRCHWHPLRASSIPGLLSILAHCSTIHLKAVFLVASDGVLAGAGVSFDLEVVGPGREQVFDGTAVVSGQLLQVVSDDGLSGSIQQFSIYLQ